LADASCEALATSVDKSCAREAVVVKVPAEASSSFDADDTVLTISPTACSNWSASLAMSFLRLSACRASSSACSARMRSVSIMLSLNTWIALAMSPISSALPRPGISTARLPPAISPIARVIEDRGPTMLRAIRKATMPPNRMARPPATS
jgi:hypothetical protein